MSAQKPRLQRVPRIEVMLSNLRRANTSETWRLSTEVRLALEGGLEVPEERDEVMLGNQKVPRQMSPRIGLSPTVERMFGALVDSSTDEADEDNASELEEESASRPHSP